MKKKIIDAYIKRSISLLRAAEGEAVQSASMLNAVHESVLLDVQKTFKNPTKKKVDALKKTVSKKLSGFYKDQWPKELIEAQTEVITKEIIWNNNLLESVRNKETLIAPRSVKIPGAGSFDGFDTKNPVWRGSLSKEKKVGQWFSSSKKFAKDFSDIDLIGDFGRKQTIGKIVPTLDEYYLPKDGRVFFSDKKLRGEFKEYLWEKEYLPDLKRNAGKPLPGWAKQRKISSWEQLAKADFKEEVGTIFQKRYSYAPHYENEELIKEFLDKKHKGWKVTQFNEVDFDDVPKKGQISFKTSSDGIAQSVMSAPSAQIVSGFAESASKRKYQGKTFANHIKKAFPNEAKRISSALTNGFNSGKNVGELTRDVKAITGRATRDVKTITRSFFMHNATEAKEKVYELNPDVVKSITWISTLDSRTTPLICGVRDGQEYTVKDKEPIGHSFPWDNGPGRIHWNCRSSSAPNVVGVSTLDSPRPSVGAGKNYERGDNKNRTGKVRKPHKKAREDGTFKIDIKTSRTKYEGWLKDQSKHNIDYVSDILGSKKKAQMFRDGKITLKQLGAQSPVASVLNKSQL